MVYINMDMPTCCCDCPMGIFEDAFVMPHCSATGDSICDEDFMHKRCDNCPLREPTIGEIVEMTIKAKRGQERG